MQVAEQEILHPTSTSSSQKELKIHRNTKPFQSILGGPQRKQGTIYPEKTLEFKSEIPGSNPNASHANLCALE